MLLSAEDGLSDTIKPRLDAAGADASRILSLATVPDENGRGRLVSIPEDLHFVERVEARLVVVDPLMAFLSGGANSHRDQDVRRALAPLAEMAERTGACVVVVRHLNKAASNNPLYRGGGSIGIIGAARVGFLVGKDPRDENRRVLAATKNNLAKHASSLLFELEEADNGAVRVVWRGGSEIAAHQLLAAPRDEERSDALSEAVEFLNAVLSTGPLPVKDIEAEADDAGIAGITLKRAKKVMGVMAYRENTLGESRGIGRWVWKLPAARLVTGGNQDDRRHPRRSTVDGDRLEQVGDDRAPGNAISKQHLQDDQGGGLQGNLLRRDRLEGSSVSESALRVEDALAELGREGSGPHLTAANRRDGAIEDEAAREWLTKAVLNARGAPTAGWERYSGVVEEAYRRWVGAVR